MAFFIDDKSRHLQIQASSQSDIVGFLNTNFPIVPSNTKLSDHYLNQLTGSDDKSKPLVQWVDNLFSEVEGYSEGTDTLNREKLVGDLGVENAIALMSCCYQLAVKSSNKEYTKKLSTILKDLQEHNPNECSKAIRDGKWTFVENDHLKAFNEALTKLARFNYWTGVAKKVGCAILLAGVAAGIAKWMSGATTNTCESGLFSSSGVCLSKKEYKTPVTPSKKDIPVLEEEELPWCKSYTISRIASEDKEELQRLNMWDEAKKHCDGSYWTNLHWTMLRKISQELLTNIEMDPDPFLSLSMAFNNALALSKFDLNKNKDVVFENLNTSIDNITQKLKFLLPEESLIISEKITEAKQIIESRDNIGIIKSFDLVLPEVASQDRIKGKEIKQAIAEGHFAKAVKQCQEWDPVLQKVPDAYRQFRSDYNGEKFKESLFVEIAIATALTDPNTLREALSSIKNAFTVSYTVAEVAKLFLEAGQTGHFFEILNQMPPGNEDAKDKLLIQLGTQTDDLAILKKVVQLTSSEYKKSAIVESAAKRFLKDKQTDHFFEILEQMPTGDTFIERTKDDLLIEFGNQSNDPATLTKAVQLTSSEYKKSAIVENAAKRFLKDKQTDHFFEILEQMPTGDAFIDRTKDELLSQLGTQTDDPATLKKAVQLTSSEYKKSAIVENAAKRFLEAGQKDQFVQILEQMPSEFKRTKDELLARMKKQK